MRPTRRSLLEFAAYTGIASMMPKAGWARTMRPIGLQLYTVQDAIKADAAGTFKKIYEIGYREVETFPLAGVAPPQLKKMLDDAGLKVPSAHLFFGMGPETSKLLADGTALGAEYVVSSVLLPPSRQTGDLSKTLDVLNALTLEDFKAVAVEANSIGKQAKAAGLKYAYHSHNFEFREQGGTFGYEILLKETDPELVHFELDCGWMVTAGFNPIEYFRKYPGRYPLMHAKDFPVGTKNTTTVAVDAGHTPTEIGRGHIDYKPIIAAAEKSGVQHIFVEQDPPIKNMSSMEAIAISYKALRPLV